MRFQLFLNHIDIKLKKGFYWSCFHWNLINFQDNSLCSIQRDMKVKSAMANSSNVSVRLTSEQASSTWWTFIQDKLQKRTHWCCTEILRFMIWFLQWWTWVNCGLHLHILRSVCTGLFQVALLGRGLWFSFQFFSSSYCK